MVMKRNNCLILGFHKRNRMARAVFLCVMCFILVLFAHMAFAGCESDWNRATSLTKQADAYISKQEWKQAATALGKAADAWNNAGNSCSGENSDNARKITGAMRERAKTAWCYHNLYEGAALYEKAEGYFESEDYRQAYDHYTQAKTTLEKAAVGCTGELADEAREMLHSTNFFATLSKAENLIREGISAAEKNEWASAENFFRNAKETAHSLLTFKGKDQKALEGLVNSMDVRVKKGLNQLERVKETACNKALKEIHSVLAKKVKLIEKKEKVDWRAEEDSIHNILSQIKESLKHCGGLTDSEDMVNKVASIVQKILVYARCKGALVGIMNLKEKEKTAVKQKKWSRVLENVERLESEWDKANALCKDERDLIKTLTNWKTQMQSYHCDAGMNQAKIEAGKAERSLSQNDIPGSIKAFDRSLGLWQAATQYCERAKSRATIKNTRKMKGKFYRAYTKYYRDQAAYQSERSSKNLAQKEYDQAGKDLAEANVLLEKAAKYAAADQLKEIRGLIEAQKEIAENIQCERSWDEANAYHANIRSLILSKDIHKLSVAVKAQIDAWKAVEKNCPDVRKEKAKKAIGTMRKTAQLLPAGDPLSFTVNGVSFRMIKIPAGEFMMGSPSNERDRNSDETQHRVRIGKDYRLGETEVTQGLWKAVMGGNPSHFSSCGDDCPVERVSWDDCQDFLRRLNGMVSGVRFRLPTEAEWEYAVRAGTTTPFNTGRCLNTDQANYNGRNFTYTGCSKGEYRDKTLRVKSFAPNDWGFYDMHGNVCEWCEDRYVADPSGPSTASGRVYRGGGWYNFVWGCRSAKRHWTSPGVSSINLGFRLAFSSGQ